MSKKNFIETLTNISNHASEAGVIYLSTDDEKLNGNEISLGNQKIVNFGSCSYLGLEFEDKIKQGAINAISNYGSQFSCSRAYVSTKYYVELEEKLEKIFGSPTISTPTTTLGHIAAIPVLVSPEDAVILDHQVHSSVQTAAALTKANRTHVELVRHNRLDLLESRIQHLKTKHDKIWYMADGIYSMYGDAAPLDGIYELLDKYPQLHFYVDDAHGMSCFGKNGRGFVLAERDIHERMVVATSFAKAFATGGGALIFSNRELANTVRDCGGPLRASGPMQPAALGAAIASADIHLSDKIYRYQEDLQQNIQYTNLMLKKYNLLNLAESFSPIFFVAASLPGVAYKLINRMKADGYFVNLGIFPAVPIKNTGVRFTITRLHTFEQIEGMIKSMASHYDKVLAEENITIEQIYKAFKVPLAEEKLMDQKVNSFINESKLIVNHAKTINAIDAADWNKTIGQQGTFDYSTLQLFEQAFSQNEEKVQNWEFDYIVIKDLDNKIVLATFLTTSITKDDMLAEKDISQEIELLRREDPLYMTSKTVSLGSPLTEGNHLYLNKENRGWKEALNLLLTKIDKMSESNSINNTILRDLPEGDIEMDNIMVGQAYFKMSMPESCEIITNKWNNLSTFYQQLSTNNKRQFRKNVLRTKHHFEFEVKTEWTEQDSVNYFNLYSNVKNKSLSLNTFELPIKLFKMSSSLDNWEILSLYLKSEFDSREERKPVAMALCHKGQNDYSFVLAGLDYEYNGQHNCYRQLLAKIVERGAELNYDKIKLGFTSIIEKKRFGGKIIESVAYMQVKDNYTLEALGAMSTNNKREDGFNQRRVLSV